MDAGRPLPDVPSLVDTGRVLVDAGPPTFDASSGDTRVVITPEGLLGIGVGLEVEGVCDDSFAENEAVVACRSLGMNYISHQTSQSGPSGSFYMDDVTCSGTEASLFDCEYSPTHNCSSSEWIRLVCN